MRDQNDEMYNMMMSLLIFIVCVVAVAYGLMKWHQYDTKSVVVIKTVCEERQVYVPTVTDGTFSFLYKQSEEE